MIAPGRARRVGAAGVCVAVIAAQGFALVHGLNDPHKVFAFRMFPEASTWQADIVRVTHDGRRVPISDPWPGGYRWAQLVRGRGLTHPSRPHHADAGMASTLDFLAHALNWVASHTPSDTETHYLEAVIGYSRNLGPTETTVLRSRERASSGRPSPS